MQFRALRVHSEDRFKCCSIVSLVVRKMDQCTVSVFLVGLLWFRVQRGWQSVSSDDMQVYPIIQ
jgi:hypothetical protein